MALVILICRLYEALAPLPIGGWADAGRAPLPRTPTPHFQKLLGYNVVF